MMKKHLLFFLICFIIFEKIQSQTTSTEFQQSFVNKTHALMDAVAVGDTMVWKKYLHDSCLIAVEDGKTTTKQEMLKSMHSLPKGYVGRIEILEPQLKIYGNTAVFQYILDEYLTLFNQRIHTQYRQTDTWLMMGNEWKMISMQVFEIPKNPPPIEVDSSILKEYIGNYALGEERKCVIFVKNGQLYAQKGDRPAEVLLAETQTVFFRKHDGRGRVIFIFDAGEKAYKMIERRAGEDLVWRK